MKKHLVGRFRRWLLNFFKPLTDWMGRQHMPFSRKRISGADYFEISEHLEPGVVLLSVTKGELSNYLNPGFWKHGAMYIGDHKLIEAVGRGVVTTNVIDFVMKKDFVAVLKPLFANSDEMKAAAEKSKEFIGSPYDFAFEFEDKAFYCYEVIYRAYKAVLDDMPFKPRPDVLGHPVIVGDDFFEATEKWHSLWHNRTDLT